MKPFTSHLLMAAAAASATLVVASDASALEGTATTTQRRDAFLAAKGKRTGDARRFWSKPADLGTVDQATNPQLAANRSGRAIVAWRTDDGLRIATRDTPTGPFLTTVVPRRGGPPQIATAIGENGTAVTAWSETVPGSGPGGLPLLGVFAATKAASDARPGPPQELWRGEGPYPNTTLYAAVSPSGAPVVGGVGSEVRGGFPLSQPALLAAVGTVSGFSTSTVAPITLTTYFPGFLYAPGGGVTAYWMNRDGTVDGSTLPADSPRFGAPRRLSPGAGKQSDRTSFTSNLQGRQLLAFTQALGRQVLATKTGSDGTFPPARVVARTSGGAKWTASTLDAGGRAVVTWQRGRYGDILRESPTGRFTLSQAVTSKCHLVSQGGESAWTDLGVNPRGDIAAVFPVVASELYDPKLGGAASAFGLEVVIRPAGQSTFAAPIFFPRFGAGRIAVDRAGNVTLISIAGLDNQRMTASVLTARNLAKAAAFQASPPRQCPRPSPGGGRGR